MNYEQLKTELQALNAEIDERERRIARYEKLGLLPDEPNVAYVFNFTFPGVDGAAKYAVQEQTVQIKKDTIFFAKSFSQAYTITGTRADVAQAARLTLPATTRLLLLDYNFKIRDTGSDREWQNDWVPGNMLLTGNYNGFRLREGHALCSPGSEVTIQVDAQSFGNQAFLTKVNIIQSQELQIVMAGFEVPFKEVA